MSNNGLTQNNNTVQEEKFVVKRTPKQREKSTVDQYWRSFEAIGVEFSKIMNAVFSDYDGIEFRMENNIIYPIIYFKTGDMAISNDGRVRAYQPIEIGDTRNVNVGRAAFNAFSYMSKKKKHTITKEGQDVLSELVYCNKPSDFNWNNNFNEEVIQQNYGGRVYPRERIAATGFDFIKLLRFIKIGGINDIEDERKYNITLQLIPCNRYSTTANVAYGALVAISVYNMEEFNNVAIAYGVGIPPQFTDGSGMIITADTAL